MARIFRSILVDRIQDRRFAVLVLARINDDTVDRVQSGFVLAACRAGRIGEPWFPP